MNRHKRLREYCSEPSDLTISLWVGCEPTSPGCSYCAWSNTEARRGEYHKGGRVYRGRPVDWSRLKAFDRSGQLTGNRLIVTVNPFSDFFDIRDQTILDSRPGVPAPEISTYPETQDIARIQFFDVASCMTSVVFTIETKFPQNFENVLTRLLDRIDNDPVVSARDHRTARSVIAACLNGIPPANIWLGASVERDAYLGRIERLRSIPSALHFASFSPLLGHVDSWDPQGIGWVLISGEVIDDSRKSSLLSEFCRPVLTTWFDSILEKCEEPRIPVWFRQLGSIVCFPEYQEYSDHFGDPFYTIGSVIDPKCPLGTRRIVTTDQKARDPRTWPSRYRRREYPSALVVPPIFQDPIRWEVSGPGGEVSS